MKKLLIIVLILFTVLSFGQQTKYVDFKIANVVVDIQPDSNTVTGVVVYKFDILKSTDSIVIDGKNFEIKSVKYNNETVNYKYNNKKISVIKTFEASKSDSISITYSAKPKKALYFLKRKDDWNIWTQGQGKYTSNWLPSFDDVNEKVVFNLTIIADKGYEALANGRLVHKADYFEKVKWQYKMKDPISSYLVALVVGKYDSHKTTSKSGVPLGLYYYPEDSLRVEPTYRYTEDMFNFLEEEIGVAYPWQNYKQAPVHDFLYAGMENASLTIFSDAFVVDAIGYNDKNYVNVNAHELAHQWFGDLVTATSGEHHWLQEGFATYYALLAERRIKGDNYYYFKLFESMLDLSRQDLSGNGTSLLNPKSSSLTFYQRGAWVLHVLRTQVGDKVFKKAVQNYLKKYRFKSVNTSNFIKEVERLYGRSLSGFVNLWIKQKSFPYEKALEILKKQSPFVNEYLMVDCEAKNSKCADYLKYYVSDEAKAKVIAQYPELVTKNTFKNGLKVRQAISRYVRTIPESIKSEYETLLGDESYITIENALYNLWKNFPEDRAKYLSRVRNVVGLNDKNVRLLWIVLTLNTPFYTADNKAELFNELLSYTEAKYGADLQMNAFNYLRSANACNDLCKTNLEQAKKHHNWRLVKFAKEFSNQLQSKN